MTILAADSVPAARETARTPAMADKPPATSAHVTFSATRPVSGARETIGFRCDPPEPGLVDRPGQTAPGSCHRDLLHAGSPAAGADPAIAASSARSASIQLAQRRPRPVSLDQSLGVLAGLIG
jgi:hypothetical protein